MEPDAALYLKYHQALDKLAVAIQHLPPNCSQGLITPFTEFVDALAAHQENFSTNMSLQIESLRFDLSCTKRERDTFRRERDEYFDFIETEMRQSDEEDA